MENNLQATKARFLKAIRHHKSETDPIVIPFLIDTMTKIT